GLYGTPPAELHALAPEELTPEGAMAFLATAQGAALGGEYEMLVWAYRALGPHLPSPSLAAMFLIAHLNAMFRTERVLRPLGPEGQGPALSAHSLAARCEHARRSRRRPGPRLDPPRKPHAARADRCEAHGGARLDAERLRHGLRRRPGAGREPERAHRRDRPRSVHRHPAPSLRALPSGERRLTHLTREGRFATK